MGSFVSLDGSPETGARPEAEWALTLPPALANPVELKYIRDNVQRLLSDVWPTLKNSSYLSTWKERDLAMRSVGPPMVLLRWQTLSQLGKIPHSSQGYTITLEEASKEAEKNDKRFFIEMFSHRWLRKSHPDDQNHIKARCLVEWAKYRDSQGIQTFYWIDFACINQYDIYPGIGMLPLYVSSCNNILCFETPEYEARAWCRLERVLFASFVAPNNEFLHSNFTFDADAERLPNNELKPSAEDPSKLPDPTKGYLSWGGDGPLIDDLTKLCKMHWGKCWKDGLMDICETKGKLENLRTLKFDFTQVRMRKFRSAHGGMEAVQEPLYADQLGRQVANPLGGFDRGVSDMPGGRAARECCRPRWGPPRYQAQNYNNWAPAVCCGAQTRPDAPPPLGVVLTDMDPKLGA
mmetsp:Transcript_31724/g.58243  ORF Transcript_31724/g.58243 Transcript_31724/m.58243 type:complete len:406 (-) Transcript_31724:97-1314(-)